MIDTESATARNLETKLRVFVSYSRTDRAFAERLVTALESRGFDVLIDRRSLPALEDWERELLSLIRQADTVVFIVSHNSITSKVCQWEVDQVRQHGKRLAPVVIADVQGWPVPVEVARINYIFFTDESRFEQNSDELARALNTDVFWLKDHTRIGQMAQRWHGLGRRRDALLRGSDLSDAMAWAKRRHKDAPPITIEMADYLASSQEGEKAAKLRSRRIWALMTVLGVTAAGIGALGYLGFLDQATLRIQTRRLADLVLPMALSYEKEAQLRPGDRFSECASCPEMVVVPGDATRTDAMGRTVRIQNSYAVGRYEISFDEWDACVAHGVCPFRPSFQDWGRGRVPAINISWDDAQAFVQWLAKQTGKPYRLLSDIEWDHAARGGAETRYTFGNEEAALHEFAWYSANSNSKAHPVGQKKPNAYGLYDVHGNVQEWVQDCYGQAAATCERRIIRGGAWDADVVRLNLARRELSFPNSRNYFIGFRVGRNIGISEKHSGGLPVHEPIEYVISPARQQQESYGLPAPTETDATRVSGFSYRTPQSEVDPGLRVFRRETDNTWTNRYPNGQVDVAGRIRDRIVLEGCAGSVIGKDTEPDFSVFIPDKGCPDMVARWRRGRGDWNVLGEMQDVR